MTISVDGEDSPRSFDRYTCFTDSWASKDLHDDDEGRFTIRPWPSHRFPDSLFPRFRLTQDNVYTGTVSGTVKELGAPVARIVRIYRRSDGQMAGETVSDAGTGAYSFSDLDESEQYFVMSFDDLTVAPDFNALVYDQITPG